MKKTISIIYSFEEQYYHTVNKEPKKVTLAPEREAIFNYLAQIDSNLFPEFILDVLVTVEKHKPIDITEGVGDEKQDILIKTPSGERCLIQCKHTKSYKKHFSSDEIDLLFAACFRKKCTKALFITNSDLTPQGKRYITDKEYARGGHIEKELLPEINYWNGAMIWDRIVSNNDILNKWFSGMSQAHGLRQFTFYLIIQRLPSGEVKSINSKNIAEKVKAEKSSIELDEKNSIYNVKLDDAVSFKFQKNFHSDIDLGVPYVGPKREFFHLGFPFWALKIQVVISNKIGQFDPANYRDRVVKYIGSKTLPILAEDEWWYLIATQPQAFVFFQDIVEPKVISISDAQCYVKIKDQNLSVEKDWVFIELDEFERLIGNEEKDLSWYHIPSGIKVSLLLSQLPHPIAAFEHHNSQLKLIKRLAGYEFRFIPNASQEIINRVHRMVDIKWVVMLSNNNELYWAYPSTASKLQVNNLEKALHRSGIKIYCLSEKERDKLIEQIEVSPPDPKWTLASDESRLVTPIWLNKRIFWLSKEIEITQPDRFKIWLTLLEFKFNYEAQHGFDVTQGKLEMNIIPEEIHKLLFDVLSIRGLRMLDIGFHDCKISVNLRIQEKSLDSTSSLIPKYLEEMAEILRELSDLLK